MKTRHERDLDEFFGFVLDKSLSSSDFLFRYHGYHGLLNFGHQTLIYNELIEKFRLEGKGDYAALSQDRVLWAGGQINPNLLDELCLSEAISYPKPGKGGFDQITLRPSSENEWKSDRLPKPFNMRMQIPRRPALILYSSVGNQLFVSPYGYQYYDQASNIYWPEASSRIFGDLTGAYPSREMELDVVVVQDQFDGSNFAHYLYDYVPRIIYFCETFPNLSSKVLFLMGGVCGTFQMIFIDLLCKKYGLTVNQFIFPVEREIWNLKNRIHFFSDQSIAICHPMGICDPTTVRFIRDLISDLRLPDEGRPKIYIKRSANDFRRIRNDAEVTDVLVKLGYQGVDLAGFEVRKQLALLASAIAIAGPHGMGLTGIVGTRRACRVLEMFNPVIGSDTYALVCRSMGVNYSFLIGTDSDERDRLSYVVDVDLVESLAS